MEDVHDLETKLEKWRRPMQGALVFLVFLIVYFFAYPALIVLLENRTSFFEDIPLWLENALIFTVTPILWMMEQSDFYESYLDWLEAVFP